MVESRAYRAAKERGEIAYSEFGTDPCRSLFARVFAMFAPKISDNPNVNLAWLGERFIAMTETPIPVEFDPQTLAAAGVAYEAPGLLTTAHPHLDRDGGAMLNYAARLGPRNRYRFFRLEPGSREPRVIAEQPVGEPAYMHSFGLSERWLILAEFPSWSTRCGSLSAAAPIIENYAGSPARHPLHPLRPRQRRGHGALRDRRLLRLPPRQRLRARRRGGGRHLRLPGRRRCRRRIHGPAAPRRGGPGAVGAALPHRPGGRTVSHERLAPDGFDLPRINYGRHNERPYRCAWGVGGPAPPAGSTTSSAPTSRPAARRPGQSRTASPASRSSSPARGAEAEDDGVLLTLVFDGARGGTRLVVLDARSLEEVARAEAPHTIPFGFHGQFARA